jgi:hypothetical protein
LVPEGTILAMATFAIASQRFTPDTTIVSLTTVQSALWQLSMPILDAAAVTAYKKRAKRVMLWRAIRWQLLGLVAMVALLCLGRQWGRVAAVSGSAVVFATLFAWLVNASDLHWLTLDYSTYKSVYGVPANVSAAATALLRSGIAHERIGVEYLKNDPILYVEDNEQRPGVKRYDLIIW